MKRDIKGAAMRLEIGLPFMCCGVKPECEVEPFSTGRRLCEEALNLLRSAPSKKLTKAERATLKAGAGKGEEGGAA